MAHPETLLDMPDIDDSLQRFVSVVKFYLSGWHIKPPYVFWRQIGIYERANEPPQRCQEASQSDLGRNLHWLLGLQRRYSRLLHCGTDFPPPSKVELLLYGTGTSHSHRWHVETTE
jgi:hypothetical protein